MLFDQNEDRYERIQGGFHERLRKGFKKMARDAADHFVVIDGSAKVEEVQESVRRAVSQFFDMRIPKIPTPEDLNFL